MKTIIIVAVTLDGKIAKDSTQNVDWTSKEDKDFFRRETKRIGVVIFGAKTYTAIGRPLPDRLNIIITKEPQKYKYLKQPNLLEFTSDPPEMILEALAKRGYKEVVIGGGSTIYSLFLQKNLIDEIYLTIAPKIFGKGVNLFKEMEIEEINLELIELNQLGEGEILVKYRIPKIKRI